jgi:hypothetical protein
MGKPKNVTCIFCGHTRERGKEHVFSERLLGLLGLKGDRLTLERRTSQDDASKWSRTLVLNSFLSGSICKACNTGWMSRLESEVVPIINAISARNHLEALRDGPQNAAFCQWALKTACTIDHACGMGEVPAELARELVERPDLLPQNVGVFVGLHEIEDPGSISLGQRNAWAHFPQSEICKDPQCSPEGTWFKVAYGIQRLMVLVAGMPSPHFQFVIGTGMHVILWPRIERPCHRFSMGAKLQVGDTISELTYFSNALGVSHGGRMR